MLYKETETLRIYYQKMTNNTLCGLYEQKIYLPKFKFIICHSVKNEFSAVKICSVTNIKKVLLSSSVILSLISLTYVYLELRILIGYKNANPMQTQLGE